MKVWKKYALIASVSVLVLGFGIWFLMRGPKLGAASLDEHTLVAHERVDATCLSAGMREYWQCADCDQYFRDEKGLSLIADDEFADWVKLPKLQHKSGARYFKKGVEATCDHEGNKAYYICTQGCGNCFVDVECKTLINDVILPQKNHKGILIEAQDATCDGDGCVAHYECSSCHQTFLDAACTIRKDDIALKGGHQTDAEHLVEYQAPTCLADGHLAHYACTTCDKVFRDIDCKEDITDIYILPQIEHSSDSDYHTPYLAATCEVDGTMEYWECKNGCHQKFTTYLCDKLLTVDPTIPAFGHAYDPDTMREENENLVSAASRAYEGGKLVYKNAVYKETCYRCGKVRTTKELSGFATLISTGIKASYEDDGDTVNDVFTVDASALVERDGQWTVDIKIYSAATCNAHSKYQFTDQNGDVTTVTDLSADVRNHIMTLKVRLDEKPTGDVELVWAFDWDGDKDGTYEQVIKVKIAA